MAMYLNRAMVIGNLTRDPEMRQLPSGQSVANFAVATNRSFNDKEGNKRDDVEFHNVVVWGKLAEICGQYLGKGRKVYIEGRLQTRSWDGQDGVSRSKTEIVADNMIMLDKAGAQSGGNQQAQGNNWKSQNNFQSQGQQGSYNKGNQQAAPQPEAQLPTISLDEEPQAGGSDAIRIEDIPF